jgi:hypothetical protein
VKYLKKLLTMLLSIILIFGLIGCNNRREIEPEPTPAGVIGGVGHAEVSAGIVPPGGPPGGEGSINVFADEVRRVAFDNYMVYGLLPFTGNTQVPVSQRIPGHVYDMVGVGGISWVENHLGEPVDPLEVDLDTTWQMAGYMDSFGNYHSYGYVRPIIGEYFELPTDTVFMLITSVDMGEYTTGYWANTPEGYIWIEMYYEREGAFIGEFGFNMINLMPHIVGFPDEFFVADPNTWDMEIWGPPVFTSDTAILAFHSSFHSDQVGRYVFLEHWDGVMAITVSEIYYPALQFGYVDDNMRLVMLEESEVDLRVSQEQNAFVMFYEIIDPQRDDYLLFFRARIAMHMNDYDYGEMYFIYQIVSSQTEEPIFDSFEDFLMELYGRQLQFRNWGLEIAVPSSGVPASGIDGFDELGVWKETGNTVAKVEVNAAQELVLTFETYPTRLPTGIMFYLDFEGLYAIDAEHLDPNPDAIREGLTVKTFDMSEWWDEFDEVYFSFDAAIWKIK